MYSVYAIFFQCWEYLSFSASYTAVLTAAYR